MTTLTLASNHNHPIRETTKPQARVSFNIYKPNGRLIGSVVRAFLKQQKLLCWDAASGFIELPDEPNIKWLLRIDHRVMQALEGKESIEVLISYQEHVFGYFAVVKLYEPVLSTSILTK